MSESWSSDIRSKPAPNSEVRVWANPKSTIYHCPGDGAYGNTAKGQFMTEADALRNGYRPARGHYCQQASSAQLQSPIPGVTQCGFERWPVKVLADEDTAEMEWKPIETTIGKLTRIPRPEVQYQYDHRIAAEERHVYKIQAKLLRVRHEQDSDLHLLLADPHNEQNRMIAEIPAPECAVGTGHEGQYHSAREAISKLNPGSLIEVTGVGFFDYLHDQVGAAQNGIELHPVLSVRVLQTGARDTTVPVPTHY